jgi:hypothetical protein
MSRPGVITAVADAYYARLLVKVSQSVGPITELFDGDAEPTLIWRGDDGALRSKMRAEPYEKKIMPYSAVRQEVSSSRGATSKKWELIRRFVERGMDNESAMNIATVIYSKVPAHVSLSDEAVDALFEHHSNGGDKKICFSITAKGEIGGRRPVEPQ